MPPRTESDEKYILDLVAEILAEPDYRWQHRFPTLLGDPGQDGKQRLLPVDGYFPRHRLIVEYWERQHSAPVPIMDEGMTVSGVSRGDQRRLYDQRRQAWAAANGLQFVILDYRGFETDQQGRLQRNPARDRLIAADALRAAADCPTVPAEEVIVVEDRDLVMHEVDLQTNLRPLIHHQRQGTEQFVAVEDSSLTVHFQLDRPFRAEVTAVVIGQNN